MVELIVVTNLFQVVSSIVIALIIFKYFRLYKRDYLKCWSYSFIALAVYMSLSALLQVLSSNSFLYTSTGMYLLSLVKINAGYLQMTWLLLGTFALINVGGQDKPHSKKIIYSVMLFASIMATLFAFDSDGGLYRNALRSGSRYLLGGIVFLIAFVMTARFVNRNSLGKWLVSISFLIYGIELTAMGVLNLKLLIGGSSQLLLTLVKYHGLIELLIYPTIALGLVIWFLDYERQKGQLIYQKLAIINDSDSLTGLANQRGFERLLLRWQNSQEKSQARLLVIFIGIDQFKRINQAVGIRKGDEVLVAFADRMTEKLGAYSNQARISGDVFGCIISEEKIGDLNLNWLVRMFSQPLIVNDQSIHIDVSVGASWLSIAEPFEQAMLCAQRSLDTAKSQGGKKALLFDDSMPDNNDSLELENQLRKALQEDEFEVFLQPLYCARTEKLTGFEVLSRWNHPTKGLLPPFEFLPYLSSLNLLQELDQWVLEQAIELLLKWKNSGRGHLFLAVNLSAESLQDDHYLHKASNLINKLKGHTGMLHLEMTENSAIKSINAGKQSLSLLSELGVRISIDDFGTGYSSLNYLRSLPADKVKFDRSFIKEMTESTATLEILKSLVPLCQKLGKSVVAEGIENEQQRKLAKNIGFDELQGFIFSEPVIVETAETMIEQSESKVAKSIARL